MVLLPDRSFPFFLCFSHCHSREKIGYVLFLWSKSPYLSMFVQHGMVVDVAVAVIRCYHPYSFQIYLGKTQHLEKSRHDTHEPVLKPGNVGIDGKSGREIPGARFIRVHVYVFIVCEGA